ncbi:MAG TPA: hypothetical protein VKB09_17060 [Thermomicrobiales bacterium]|nr:hypothetical protein [Thermomicrobiales bacterium]
MIVVAFLMFAVLVVAWLIAPNGEPKTEPAKPVTGSLKIGDARA